MKRKKRGAFSFCISVITCFLPATGHLHIRGTAEKENRILLHLMCSQEKRLRNSEKWRERASARRMSEFACLENIVAKERALCVCVCVHIPRSRCYCIRKMKETKNKTLIRFAIVCTLSLSLSIWPLFALHFVSQMPRFDYYPNDYVGRWPSAQSTDVNPRAVRSFRPTREKKNNAKANNERVNEPRNLYTLLNSYFAKMTSFSSIFRSASQLTHLQLSGLSVSRARMPKKM